MSPLADFYLDNAGTLFLAGFLAVSVALVLAARRWLSDWWWTGALASGIVIIGLTTTIALALQGFDSGDPDGLEPQGIFAIGVAGVLGFIAGTDVQLAIGQIRGRQGGIGTVLAGAVIGPAVVVGGYLLLVRSMEWIR